jgi:putative salt-induced outer membrane protein YdiY
VRISLPRLYLSLLCLLLPVSGLADEVFLKNGDRLSGILVSKSGDKLVLETSYAGKIEILWSDVSHLTTQQAVRILLDDETERSGILSATDGAELRIAADIDAEPESLPMARIAAINPPVMPRLKIKGQANAGFDWDRGNTDQDTYHVDAESIFRWPDDRFTLNGSGNLEKSNGDKTKQQADLAGKYDHFLNGKWYLYSGLGFEHDKFADLTLRTKLTAGTGYQIFETDRTNLSIEGGPAYVWENYDNSENQDYAAARWALRFDHFLIEAWKLQAFHKHSLDWSLEESSDYLFQSETGLRIPIFDSLQATAQVNFDRDNAPAAGAKKNDYEYLITGGYTW